MYYTTVSGDTWDMIAFKVYGDEMRATELLKAPENITLIDTEIFSAGVTVWCPEINTTVNAADELPEWRR